MKSAFYDSIKTNPEEESFSFLWQWHIFLVKIRILFGAGNRNADIHGDKLLSVEMIKLKLILETCGCPLFVWPVNVLKKT